MGSVHWTGLTPGLTRHVVEGYSEVQASTVREQT